MKKSLAMIAAIIVFLPFFASASSDALMIIRFYRGNVDYRQALFQAMAQTMQTSPELGFVVVAASPDNSDGRTAEKYMRQVIKDMGEIGMPPEKISTSSTREGGLEGPEVRIYVNPR